MDLYVEEFGEPSTQDVIVMLHGGPAASHDYLRPQMDALAVADDGKQRKLVYYDQRGGGKSPRDPVGIDRHVADLEMIREWLKLERLRLCGYSWGGLLAMSYAVEHPDRVEKMALVSPAPSHAAGRAQMKERMAQAAKRPEVEAMRKQLDPQNRQHRFALAVAGYFVDPRRALELTPFMVQQRAEQAVWSSLGEYDLRPKLREIDVDAIVVHGVDDPIPIETARETAEILGAEFVGLDHCGHVPYVEAADRLFPTLKTFFK